MSLDLDIFLVAIEYNAYCMTDRMGKVPVNRDPRDVKESSKRRQTGSDPVIHTIPFHRGASNGGKMNTTIYIMVRI